MDIFSIGTKAKTDTVNGVTVRSLPLGQKSRLEAIISKEGNKTAKDCSDVRWIALRYGIVDEEGNPVLGDDDRQRFNELETWFVEPCFERILELSGVTDKDRDEFLKN